MDENRLSPEREAEHTVQAAPCASDADVEALALNRYPNKPWLAKHAFQPGQSGNPAGRKPVADGGKVDRRTLFREAFERGGMAVIEKALEMAAAGDQKMIDTCLKYITPQAKAESGLLDLNLPPEATVEDRLAAITLAMTEGRISPETAALASKAIRDQTEAAKILQASQGIAELQAQLKAKTVRGRTL